MLGPLLSAALVGFVLGAIGMALATRGVDGGVARARWLKFGVFFVIVQAVLLTAVAGTWWLRALFAVLLACCALEAAAAWRRVPAPRPWGAPPIAIGLGSACAVALWCHQAGALVWCFMTIACADGFAQIIGQLLGRHALAPRLSPGKTVEGALGGLVAGTLVAVALRTLVPVDSAGALARGALLALAGLGGDLAASWLKRRAALKDFSTALPGQGGFLDRFDSLIGALALLPLLGLAN